MNRIDYLSKKYDCKSKAELDFKHDLDYFFNKYYIKKHIRDEVVYIVEDVGNLKRCGKDLKMNEVLACITLFVLWSNNHSLDIYSTNMYISEHISRAMYGRVVSGLLEIYRGKDSVKSGKVVEQYDTPTNHTLSN